MSITAIIYTCCKCRKRQSYYGKEVGFIHREAYRDGWRLKEAGKGKVGVYICGQCRIDGGGMECAGNA